MAWSRTLGAVAVGLTLLCGCETEVRQGPPRAAGPDVAVPKHRREEDLRARVEKEPTDPSGWFAYGSYWEECSEFRRAIQCYERGNELMDQKQWTGGNYSLGKAYFQLGDYVQALRHLDLVLALESADPKVACLNNHFAESHYLKGAIYFLHKNWRKSRTEFMRFLELGGEDTRVEEFLDRIDRETR